MTGCIAGTGGSGAGAPNLFAHGGGILDPAYARQVQSAMGGPDAPLLIVPYSGEPEATAAAQFSATSALAFRNVLVLGISDPQTALERIASASGIWFAGGSQRRQVTTLAGVPGLVETLRAANAAGTVVAGSSAGAAVMSQLMISGGSGGDVFTRQGLGFWPEVVIDQHVAERDRAYRLRRVIGDRPSLVGVGLDEATWVARRDSAFDVFGRGVARVVTAGPDDVQELGLRAGDSFDIGARARV
ncbi:MAG: cyanophycinase [Pseudomonadota bacterium]